MAARAPAYTEMVRGLQSYAKSNPDKATFVEAVWTEVQPSDLTLALRRLVNAGTDVIVIQTNTTQAVATKRAWQALGKNAPIMLSLHNGLSGSSKALGDPDGFAGDFEVGAIADASESDTQARKFYQLLQEKHGLKSGWNAMTVLGHGQGIVAARAIKAVIKSKGVGKVTGEAVRETLPASRFTGNDLMGMLPGVDFSNDAPLPHRHSQGQHRHDEKWQSGPVRRRRPGAHGAEMVNSAHATAPDRRAPSPAAAMAALLTLSNVEGLNAEVILALKGVSMQIPAGGCVTLLGANGAGKSTTLKAISGVIDSGDGRVSGGVITFDGRPIQGHGPSTVVRDGRRVRGHSALGDAVRRSVPGPGPRGRAQELSRGQARQAAQALAGVTGGRLVVFLV